MRRLLCAFVAAMISLPTYVSCDILGDLMDDMQQEQEDNENDDSSEEGEVGPGDEENSTGGEKEEPRLECDPNILPLSSDAQQFEFRFFVNVAWSIVIDENVDWLTVDKSEGEPGEYGLQFFVEENNDYDERNAKFIILYGDQQADFVVYQNQKNALVLSQSRIELPVAGGTFDITVDANVSVTVANSDSDWLHQVSTKGLVSNVFSFSADPSELPDSRQAKIYVRGAGMQETVDVYQAGEEVFVLSERSFVVASSASEIKIDVRSNMDYTVSVKDSWIREQKTKSISSVTRTFVIDENTGYDAREADVVFTTSKGKTEAVRITQAQKDAIVLAKSEYDVPSAGGTLEFNVSSNIDFDVNCSAEWISAVQTKGLTDKLMSFAVQSNNDTNAEPREAVITFSNGDVQQKVTVRQAASTVRTINVATAGTLSTLITKNELMTLTELTLTGEMNQTDMAMMSSTNASDRKKYELVRLDMSGVTLTDKTINGIYLTKLEEIVLPSGVETIGDKAFDYCENLKEIIIPATVKSFSTGAFDNCTALSKVEFANPSSLETFTVYSSRGLFAQCPNLKSFEIPASVTNIAANTFRDSQIESIVIPETVRILDGNSLFRNCVNLKTVTLPSYVKDISNDMFNGCSSLESVKMSGAIRSVGSYAFQNCEKLKEFDVDSMIEVAQGAFAGTGVESFDAPDWMTVVPDNLFMNCKCLRTVDLSGLTELGYRSFYGCISLRRVEIPATMETIDPSAFNDCPVLSEVSFKAQNITFAHTSNHPPFSGTAIKELVIPAYVRKAVAMQPFPTVEKVTFESGSNCEIYGFNTPLISQISLPSSLKTIEDKTFEYCQNLKSLTIPEGVTRLGTYCFRGSAIETLKLPASLKELGALSMAGMSCKEFTVPETVEHIRVGCFYDCKKLEQINLPKSLKSFGLPDENSYSNKGVLENTLITELVLHGKNLVLGNAICPEYLRTFVVGKDVETITTVIMNETNEWVSEVYSPLMNSNIYQVDYEDGCVLKSIEGLYSKSPAQNVTNLPSSLKNIGHCTFGQCGNLIKVVIPDGVTSLGNCCFKDDTKLSQLTLPSSITHIGSRCFENCTSLPDTFTLPSSLTTAGGSIFNGCKFENVSIPSAMSHIPNSMFSNAEIGSINIPSSVTSIDSYAFAYCAGLKSITLSSVKTIPQSAFLCCPDLETVVLSSAEEIGETAFSDCASLKSVKIPSVKFIDNYAFANCASLTTIGLPVTLEEIKPCFSGTGIQEIYLNGAETVKFNFAESSIKKVTISKNIVHLEGSFTGMIGSGPQGKGEDEVSKIEVVFEKDSQVKTFGRTFWYAPIEELILPRSITRIDANAFNSSTIKKLYLTSESAPTLYGRLSTLAEETGELIIYVPEEKEELYKYWASPNWTHYADIMVPYNYRWVDVP